MMNHKFSKFDDELYRRIDEVIHYMWDPIGISCHPGARDEYHIYLPEIYRLIKSEEIATLKEYMKEIAATNMSLDDNTQSSINSAITTMLEWKAYLESECDDEATLDNPINAVQKPESASTKSASKLSDFHASQYLENEDKITAFLESVIADDDWDILLASIGHAAKARAINELALRLGIDRDLFFATVRPEPLPLPIAELLRPLIFASASTDSTTKPPKFNLFQYCLHEMMRHISEEIYHAGWLDDLEFRLWRDSEFGTSHEGPFEIDDDQAGKLRELSRLCGGWIAWSDSLGGPEWIPLERWLPLYQRWAERT